MLLNIIKNCNVSRGYLIDFMTNEMYNSARN